MFWLWLSLSASCLGGLVLSASKNKLFLVYREIFQLVDPAQHQYVFSKGVLGEFCQLQLFPAEIYLFFRHWNFKTNLTSRTHASCVSSQLAAFADIFGVREEFFCPAFIRLNLVTALSRFHERCTFTWRPWILKCLEVTCNWYHISPTWQVFCQERKLLIDLICSGAKTHLLWHPPPLPMGILYSPQFRSHQETKMAARRTQRSTSTV